MGETAVVGALRLFPGISANIVENITGSALAQAGVISGHDMIAEAALTKLAYLLNRNIAPESIKAQMQFD